MEEEGDDTDEAGDLVVKVDAREGSSAAVEAADDAAHNEDEFAVDDDAANPYNDGEASTADSGATLDAGDDDNVTAANGKHSDSLVELACCFESGERGSKPLVKSIE